PPAQHRAVRCLARSCTRLAEIEALGLRSRGGAVDIVDRERPRDEPRLAQIVDAERSRSWWRRRCHVGPYDLEIVSGPEPDQKVLRAGGRVPATRRGRHA